MVKLGARVGVVVVGDRVGVKLADRVGVVVIGRVGLKLEERVGMKLEDLVGEIVGNDERGDIVGNLVGEAVGTRLGAHVGLKVGLKFTAVRSNSERRELAFGPAVGFTTGVDTGIGEEIDELHWCPLNSGMKSTT